MAATKGILQFSVASVVEDVLQQHGKGLSDIDLASRKAEEASLRRYEAAGWLRKMVGVVGGKDLPAEPSEEEFRLGLRSGIILCNVLNKVQPGAVPKVVEAPSDSVLVPDGAALSAFQYFENVRNFLVAIEEMGIPSFEACDLEQGGKSSRIVHCVLAMKSYDDWKRAGGIGLWKYSGNVKPCSSGKPFVRKSSEPFMNSISRNSSAGEKAFDSLSSEQLSCNDPGDYSDEKQGSSRSLHMLIRELLGDKKQEDIPKIVESMLSKVMEEFERRLASQPEQMKMTLKDTSSSDSNEFLGEPAPRDTDMEDEATSRITEDKFHDEQDIHYGGTKRQNVRQEELVEQQSRGIRELKSTLYAAKEDVQLLKMKYQEEVNNLGKHLHSLANAASGYQKVLEENRKLYNQVQDLKGSIRVYCRVRPFLPGQPHRLSTVDYIDEGKLTIITPSKSGKDGKKSFSFNKVFGPSATQEEVFADTQPLVRSVLDGYNVCIFAYGQTGSGKTYTMSGPDDLTEENLGVNYRALSDLFLISEQRKDTISYDVSVQMIEIYNEQVRDLLVTDGLNKRLEIRSSPQKGMSVPDANLVPVTSSSDVINLMNLGHKNRAVSATAMNDRSSRSHSCLTVHVQGRDLTSGTILRGCMHLVDLAGSERVDKSEAVGDRLKEAQHINKSLSALGDVISSLAQKNSHVPYRNSKLTQLLQDSLGGQAKTLMFVHISPEPDAIGETISTLKFAERVATVELGVARANKESADVKELKEQIAALKAALARKDAEPGRFQHSRSSSPDKLRMKSRGSSPSRSSWQSLGDAADYRQRIMDFDNNTEGRDSAAKLKRRSLDPQDILMSSPSWPSVGSPGLKEDEREAVLADWVDKVMVNKQDALNRENLLARWEEENRQLPEMFYQKYSPDASRIGSELLANKKDGQDDDVSRTQCDVVTMDDSDELEAATSDSSEADYLYQVSAPKATNIPNGVGSKMRKPSPKQAKSPEIRSQIPTPPSRRLSNGHNPPLQKAGRPVEGKRKPGSGK